MLRRKTYLPILLLFVFSGLTVSCSNGKKEKPEVLEVNDDFNKYIVQGPDTNIYPLYQIASSQRFPEDRYGMQLLFDQNKETYWTSSLKTNAGEGISLFFERFSPKKVKIDITDNLLVAGVSQVAVYINGKHQGNFGKNITVDIKEPFLYSLQIIALNADGENEVKFPFIQNNSPTQSFIVDERLTNRYNSKAFGISEIEFYDENDHLLPVKSKAFREADVILTDSSGVKSGLRYLLFDDNTSTGIHWKEGINPTNFYINFKEITPIVKLRIFNGVGSLNVPTFKSITIGLTGGNNAPTETFDLKPGENILVPATPFIGTNLGLELNWQNGEKEGYLSHIEAFDGAKWFNIRINTAEKAFEMQADTLKKYEFQYVLDNYIYHTKQTVFTTSDTLSPKNPESIPHHEIKSKRTVKSEVIFRSNNTFLIKQIIQIDQLIPEYKSSVYTYRYEGTWKVAQAKKPSLVVLLTGYYKASLISDSDKVNGQPPIDLIQKITFSNNHIQFEEIFDPILISY